MNSSFVSLFLKYIIATLSIAVWCNQSLANDSLIQLRRHQAGQSAFISGWCFKVCRFWRFWNVSKGQWSIEEISRKSSFHGSRIMHRESWRSIRKSCRYLVYGCYALLFDLWSSPFHQYQLYRAQFQNMQWFVSSSGLQYEKRSYGLNCWVHSVEYDKDTNPELVMLLQKLLEKDPEKRITISELRVMYINMG